MVYGLWLMAYGAWFMVYGLEVRVLELKSCPEDFTAVCHENCHFDSWNLLNHITYSRKYHQDIGPVFKAHRLLYHSNLGLRVIKKKKKGSSNEHGAGVSS